MTIKKFSWKTAQYETLPGTEDWQEVAELTTGSCDWTEMRVYYSPNTRRYHYREDSGCSCNSWEGGISTVSDFRDGDKQDAIRAAKNLELNNKYDKETQARFIAKIRDHNPQVLVK